MTMLFEIGQRYSFDLHGKGLLPNKVTNVKVISVLNGLTAERLGYNVSTKHKQVFPVLPVTPVTKDYNSQSYYEVQYDNGNTDCFGEYWINQSTILKETRTDVIVTLADVDPSHLSAVSEVLAANGYNVVSIKQDTHS